VKLRDLTIEEFIRLGREEGFTDEEQLVEVWEARPVECNYSERSLRVAFRQMRQLGLEANAKVSATEALIMETEGRQN
jgi:hypothetical protein